MSGVKRQILAEVTAKGTDNHQEAMLKAALGPAAMRAEKGRSIYSPGATSGNDTQPYLGKNAKPVRGK